MLRRSKRVQKEWKLWPREYEYRYGKLICGIGFDLFIGAFLLRSIQKDTLFFVGEKEVTFSDFMIPVGGILSIGLIIAVLGILEIRKVSMLRKERRLLMEHFECYDGTISEIECIQVNEIVKSEADNIHNDNTHLLSKVVVKYTDWDRRERIAVSEEYGEYLSVLLKDTRAKVYVSKNGNNRIVEGLSWRQSARDGYIDVPGEDLRFLPKNVYYNMLRWKSRIEVLTLLAVFSIMLILILS